MEVGADAGVDADVAGGTAVLEGAGAAPGRHLGLFCMHRRARNIVIELTENSSLNVSCESAGRQEEPECLYHSLLSTVLQET